MDPEAEGLLDDVPVPPGTEAPKLEYTELTIEGYSVKNEYSNESCDDSDDEEEMISDVPDELEDVEWHPAVLVREQIDEPVAGSSHLESRPEQRKYDLSELYGEDTTVTCCRLKCYKKVPKKVALEHRNSFRELTKSEQDCMILGFLQSQVRIAELSKYYDQETKRGEVRRRSASSETKQDPIKYSFSGLTVCKAFYCFIHDIGERRLRNLRKHYVKEGVTPRRHGNVGKPSHNTKVTVEDIQFTVQFIKAYAEKHAIPLTDRVPKWKNSRVVKLPSSQSKASIFREFCKGLEGEKKGLVKLRTFYKIWNKYCPYITENNSVLK